MYHEEVNDGCYEGYCKLDNMRCNRRSWSCKQYIRPDKEKKEDEKCTYCHGFGFVPMYRPLKVWNKPCHICKGYGTIKKELK
jgi:DnaJ-class molecular chaperone